MIGVVILLSLLLAYWMAFAYLRERAWAKEREKLIRRIVEPRAVVVEERPKHPRPPVIAQNDDKAYKNLREERART